MLYSFFLVLFVALLLRFAQVHCDYKPRDHDEHDWQAIRQQRSDNSPTNQEKDGDADIENQKTENGNNHSINSYQKA